MHGGRDGCKRLRKWDAVGRRLESDAVEEDTEVGALEGAVEAVKVNADELEAVEDGGKAVGKDCGQDIQRQSVYEVTGTKQPDHDLVLTECSGRGGDHRQRQPRDRR